MSYVYIRSEPQLWTVGFYAPDGKWNPESDHGSSEEAAERVTRLNGGQVENTRRLDRIRDLMARFDWEHDDRQYTLEVIERIVNEGGLPVEVDTGQVRALNAAIEGIAAAVARLTEMVNFECDLRDAWYQKGRYDERAAILGGSEGRGRRPDRLRGAGFRPGYLRPVEAEPGPS